MRIKTYPNKETSKSPERLPHASVVAALFCLQINEDVIYWKLKLTAAPPETNDHDELIQCMHCHV